MQDTGTARCFPASSTGLVGDTGSPSGPLIEVNGRLFCLAASPDGRQLVTGGDGPDMFFLDLAAGRCDRVDGHPGSTVEGVLFIDDHLLLSCAGDGSFMTWDVTTREPVDKVRAHDRGIFAVLHDPARSLVITGSLDGTVKWWGLPGLAPEGMARATGKGVLSLAWTGAGSGDPAARIACGTVTGRIDLLDRDGSLASSWKAHDGPAFAIKPLPGHASSIASSGADGHVKGWDLSGNAPVLTWDVHAGQGKVLDVHPWANPGSWGMLTAGGDGSIARWIGSPGGRTCTLAGRVRPHSRTVERIVQAAGGRVLYSVSSDGTVRAMPAPRSAPRDRSG